MRYLLIGSGASYSTADVEHGYRAALEAAGHEVIDYALDGRIEAAGGWLTYCWKKHHANGGTLPRPGAPDVLYAAGIHIIEKALRHMPDWVIVISGMYLHPDILVMLRRAGQRVAVILTESPYDDDREALFIQHAHVAFTHERASVPILRHANARTYYLGHAYDPAKHTPRRIDGEDDLPRHDVVFVGTGFWERCEMLQVVHWDGIDLGLYGQWQLLGSRSPLRRYIRGGITENDTTAALYRRAKIGLNLYRTSRGFGRQVPRITHAESLNPRALELAATGCFTLSDERAEVGEIFGDAVPMFRTPAELEALIRQYLADDVLRQAQAARLPGLVAGHTYTARTAQLIETLESYS